MMGVYAIIVYFSSGKSPKFFFNGMAPAQLLAFSTSSSAATLPLTMERVENILKVPKESRILYYQLEQQLTWMARVYIRQ